MMTTNIKTVFNHPTKGQDIRRFQLGSLEKPFDQLLGFLTEIYQLSPEKFTCKYRDDDGDDCSIGSNIELIEAFRIVHQEGRSVLKVEVNVDEDQSKEESSLPQNSEPPLERTHSGSSDDFVKVEAESETKETETKVLAKSDTAIKVDEQSEKNGIPDETPSIDSSESKEPVIEIVPMHDETIQLDSHLIQTQIQSEIPSNLINPIGPSIEEKRIEPVVKEVEAQPKVKEVERTEPIAKDLTDPIVKELTEPIVNVKHIEPVEEKQSVEPAVEEKQNAEVKEKQKSDTLLFPNRIEFFFLCSQNFCMIQK